MCNVKDTSTDGWSLIESELKSSWRSLQQCARWTIEAHHPLEAGDEP
jgi:hypothetical protein